MLYQRFKAGAAPAETAFQVKYMPQTKPMRRVVIVDDSRTIQAILDNAFSNRADFRVVGFANDGTTAAEMIRRLMPDVVTLDLCMPYIDGEALLALIGDLKQICKIVVSDKALTNQALASRLTTAGASLCLGKSELIENSATFFKKINHAADLLAEKAKAARKEHGPARLATATVDPIRPRHRYPVPVDERRRLVVGARKGLFNAVREHQFDLVTKHVATLAASPICLLTFIDQDTQWVKSAFGLEVETMPRHQAFCNYTISQGGTFVVANAAKDDRFADNSLVTGAPHIRSYTGHPVTLADGVTVGALCLIDTRVRTMSKQVLDQLAGMAGIVADMIDLRPELAA